MSSLWLPGPTCCLCAVVTFAPLASLLLFANMHCSDCWLSVIFTLQLALFHRRFCLFFFVFLLVWQRLHLVLYRHNPNPPPTTNPNPQTLQLHLNLKHLTVSVSDCFVCCKRLEPHLPISISISHCAQTKVRKDLRNILSMTTRTCRNEQHCLGIWNFLAHKIEWCSLPWAFKLYASTDEVGLPGVCKVWLNVSGHLAGPCSEPCFSRALAFKE